MSHKLLLGGVVLAGAAALLYMSQTGNLGGLSQIISNNAELSQAAVGTTVNDTPPTNVYAVQYGSGVKVTWDYPAIPNVNSNNVKFKVLRACRQNPLPADFKLQITVSTKQVQDGLADCPNLEHVKYQIIAFRTDNQVNSPRSGAVRATKILPPSNFTVKVITSGLSGYKAQLNWVDNSVNESGYRIHRRVKDSSSQEWTCCFADRPEGGGAGMQTIDNGPLSPGKTYEYMMQTVGRKGEHAESVIKEVTIPTPAGPVHNPSGSTPSPTNLKAVPTPYALNDVNLSWADNSSNEDGFKVYRSTNAESGYKLVRTTVKNDTFTTDSSTASCTTYYYQVFAYRGDTLSGRSNIAMIKTGGTNCSSNDGMQGGESTANRPTGIRFESRGWFSKYTYVKWDYPGSTSGTKFTVKRDGVVLTTTTAEYYNDRSAQRGKTYKYEVCVQGSTSRCAEPKAYTPY